MHFAALRNKPLWQSSWSRHATSVAQRVVLAVPHVEHVSKHHEAAAGTAEHDAKRRYVALRIVLRCHPKNNQLHHATSPGASHCGGGMPPLLLSALSWLSDA